MAFSQREMERMDGMCPHGPLSSNCKAWKKKHNSPISAIIASSRCLSRLFSFRRSVSEWGTGGEGERRGRKAISTTESRGEGGRETARREEEKRPRPQLASV